MYNDSSAGDGNDKAGLVVRPYVSNSSPGEQCGRGKGHVMEEKMMPTTCKREIKAAPKSLAGSDLLGVPNKDEGEVMAHPFLIILVFDGPLPRDACR
jgi:hypothetical protein